MRSTYLILIVSGVLGLLSACRPGPVDPPLKKSHVRPDFDPLSLELSEDHPWVQNSVRELWKQSVGKDAKGNRIPVAVIGTGIDYTNPDLRDALWMNSGELGEKAWANGLDDDGNGYDDDVFGYDFYSGDGLPYDWHGHDTYTSALIAASGRNENRVVGVAPYAALMVLRYLGPDGRGEALDAYLAFEYAIQNGAKVIYFNWPNRGFGYYNDRLVIEAIAKAGKANILVVIPAGNDSNQETSPFILHEDLQRMEHVLIVSGHDEKGELTSTTNYGRRLASIAARSTGMISYFPGHQIENGSLSTSSVAAAQVAGAAALVATLPGYGSAVGIRRALMDAAQAPESGRLEVLSGGALNLKKFVDP